MLSGFGFWSHDIGGFEDTSTADVYKRWCAFGLLSSHSRLHGSRSYRVPWLYDEEAVEVLRFFTKLKMRLMPYLYRAAIEAHEEGLPVMRAMVLEFEKDRMCRYLDRQYMLGDSLLVAPVMNEEPCGYCEIPLWVRPGTILALGSRDDRPEYAYEVGVTFRIYELKEGKKAGTVLYGMDQKEKRRLTAIRMKNSIEITSEGTGAYTVELIGARVLSAEGAACQVLEGKSVLSDCNGHVTIAVESLQAAK